MSSCASRGPPGPSSSASRLQEPEKSKTRPTTAVSDVSHSEDEAGFEAAPTEEWEWVYDDFTAQKDLEESVMRTEATRKQWETTMTNAARIRKHLARLEQEPVSGREEQWDTPRANNAQNSAQPTRATSPCLLDAEKRLSYVAGHMSKSQERFLNFTKRRTLQEEGWAVSQAKLVASLEASDVRCAEQQRLLVDGQRRRAFNNAQKRCEQQKVLREVQKEQEKIWEAFYNQSRPTSGMQPSPEVSKPGSSVASRSPPVSRQGLGSPDVNVLDSPKEPEDILRSIHHSHGKYLGQLDQWRQFVVDNERRSELQWRKVLQGVRREDVLGPEPLDGMERMQNVVKKVVLGRVFCRCAKRDKAEANPCCEAQDVCGECMSESATQAELGRGVTATASGASTMSRWHSRRQQCCDFAEKVEQYLAERGEQNEEQLRQARNRIAEHNKRISDRCKRNGKLWLEKCDVAAERRRQEHLLSDEDYSKRLAASQRRAQEDRRKQAEARFARAQRRENRMLKCQETCRASEQAKIDQTLTELNRLDAALIERESIKRAEAESRKAKDLFQVRMNQAKERKAAEMKAFLQRVKNELSEKDARTERVMRNQHISVLERERRSREKGKGCLSPSGIPPSPSRSEGCVVPLPRLSGSASVPLLLRPVDASPILPQARRQQNDSDSIADSEDSDESGAAGKAEFLEQLESHCGEWLTELRKNLRVAVV